MPGKLPNTSAFLPCLQVSASSSCLRVSSTSTALAAVDPHSTWYIFMCYVPQIGLLNLKGKNYVVLNSEFLAQLALGA